MEARYLSPEREATFPKLRKEDYQVTSPEDFRYNCIAHAAGKNDFPWWPVAEDEEGAFWPRGVPREETLEAFIAAYRTERYLPCESPEPEDGYEKVAIYVDNDGRPAHAAKQIGRGKWSSKLGDWEDIEHNTLEAVNCPAYGEAKAYLKRASVYRQPRDENVNR